MKTKQISLIELKNLVKAKVKKALSSQDFDSEAEIDKLTAPLPVAEDSTDKLKALLSDIEKSNIDSTQDYVDALREGGYNSLADSLQEMSNILSARSLAVKSINRELGRLKKLKRNK